MILMPDEQSLEHLLFCYRISFISIMPCLVASCENQRTWWAYGKFLNYSFTKADDDLGEHSLIIWVSDFETMLKIDWHSEGLFLAFLALLSA